MKKMLVTVIAAGALAVPVGVLVADDVSTDPADPVPASTDPDQVQDRARRTADAPVAAEEQNEADDNEAEARECDGQGPMARQKEQCRAEDGAGEGPFARRREQNRFEEGTGEGPMTHRRQQNRFEDCTVEEAPATPQDTREPAGGQVDTDPDDGANLQRRYGQDD